MAANDKTPGGGDHAGAQDSGKGPTSLHGNSGEAQRLRLLRRLRAGPASTIQLRRDEDIMMPAARVHELRHKFGIPIDLVWIEATTDSGCKHRVGLYVLRAGNAANDAQGVAA